MELNDILGIGKVLPIDKLIDIVANSVGKISKPYFDRKNVDTQAYLIKKLAEAKAEEMKIIANAIKDNFELTGGEIQYKDDKIALSSPKELSIETNGLISVQERVQDRINFQEVRKQINIENVTAYAAEELKNEKSITDELVDEDWTARFFRIIEEVSNEEMQVLWGRILAGEIKKPKTYSLRTLELIRNLSKIEAETFMKIANLAIETRGKNYLFKDKENKLLMENHNIPYSDIALLVEIGLMQPGTFINYQILSKTSDSEIVFTAGNIVILATIKANTPTILMPVNVFSNAGNELIKLIKRDPPFDYLKYIASSIKSETVDVKYAYITSLEKNKIIYEDPLLEFN